jgi:hypothetical protein
VTNVIPPPDAVEFKGVSQREMQRVMNAELLQDMRWWRQSFTEFAARLQGRLVNDVLQVETVIIDANATPVTRQWRAAAGSVEVNNLSTHPITVSAGGASAVAPAQGVSVYIVPAASTRTVNLAARQVTFYGTAGDSFSYQAFTAGAAPGVI